MGIFQQFPYSNFHEFNLDQIIKIMREMQDEWENTKTEWATYKDFIDNYFANLDVSEEVLHALQAMAASGELSPIIDPTIISETESWLAEHITQPTVPVVDDSLSIQGAAADAKATGEVKYLAEADQYVVNSLGQLLTDIQSATATRLVTKVYLVHKGDIVSFHEGSTVKDYLVEYYTTTADYTHESGWIKKKEYVLDADGYLSIKFRKPDNSNISVSDYDAETYLIRNNRVVDDVIKDTAEADIINVNTTDIIQGAYDRTGAVIANTTRLRLQNFVDVLVGDTVTFKPGDCAQEMIVGIVNENAYTLETAWITSETEYMITTPGHMMLLFRRSSNADIQAFRYDAEVVIKRYRTTRPGSEKYNGKMFRINAAAEIPYPVRESNTYSVSYNDIINQYEKVRGRVTSLYSDVLAGVPKPKTVTRTAIGTAGSYTLYKYIYTPAYPTKTVCLIAGTHGNEYESVYSLLEIFRMITLGEYNYPQLDEIRENVKLIIIPVVDPYGFEHNTKLNENGDNIYDQYPATEPQGVEITAIKNTLASETIDFFMDMHNDPYVVRSQKGCYGYALVTGEMYEQIYKVIMKFREIVYSEFNYESKFLDSNNKDVIVGPIASVNSGGSTAYGEKNGIPSLLVEISTGYGWGGYNEGGGAAQNPSFATYGSSDMMRICIDFYTNVLLSAYHKIAE